jgi:hypothetical protein
MRFHYYCACTSASSIQVVLAVVRILQYSSQAMPSIDRIMKAASAKKGGGPCSRVLMFQLREEMVWSAHNRPYMVQDLLTGRCWPAPDRQPPVEISEKPGGKTPVKLPKEAVDLVWAFVGPMPPQVDLSAWRCWPAPDRQPPVEISEKPGGKIPVKLPKEAVDLVWAFVGPMPPQVDLSAFFCTFVASTTNINSQPPPTNQPTMPKKQPRISPPAGVITAAMQEIRVVKPQMKAPPPPAPKAKEKAPQAPPAQAKAPIAPKIPSPPAEATEAAQAESVGAHIHCPFCRITWPISRLLDNGRLTVWYRYTEDKDVYAFSAEAPGCRHCGTRMQPGWWRLPVDKRCGGTDFPKCQAVHAKWNAKAWQWQNILQSSTKNHTQGPKIAAPNPQEPPPKMPNIDPFAWLQALNQNKTVIALQAEPGIRASTERAWEVQANKQATIESMRQAVRSLPWPSINAVSASTSKTMSLANGENVTMTGLTENALMGLSNAEQEMRRGAAERVYNSIGRVINIESSTRDTIEQLQASILEAQDTQHRKTTNHPPPTNQPRCPPPFPPPRATPHFLIAYRDFQAYRYMPLPLPSTCQPKPVYAEVVTLERFNKALKRTRDAIPVGFWQKFHDNMTSHSQKERTCVLIRCIKRAWPQYDTGASPLKTFSYFGAVKAHAGIPGAKIYDSGGQLYADPGNWVYKQVLRKVWPGCLPEMGNEKTLGDVMEAFLGFCWFMSHPDNTQRHTCHWQLQISNDLHEVIAYVSDHWDDKQLMGCW